MATSGQQIKSNSGLRSSHEACCYAGRTSVAARIRIPPEIYLAVYPVAPGLPTVLKVGRRFSVEGQHLVEPSRAIPPVVRVRDVHFPS